MSECNRRRCRRAEFRNSINGAGALIIFDAVLWGSYTWSGLVCPVWLVVSLARSVVTRQCLRAAIVRALFPVAVLMLVLANSVLQDRIAENTSARVIAVCEEFRNATGDYPDRLDQLVPHYLPSIPRAKYCLSFNDFLYYKSPSYPIISWCQFPPFGRRVYNFSTHEWRYLD